MATTTERLGAVVERLRQRWGRNAAYWASERAAPFRLLPTDTAPLDDALGGFPRGRITEFLGAPTSGMTTIALKAVAHTQARGELVVWLDLAAAFDAEYAACCGVDLSALLLAQPTTATDALELLRAFVASGAVGLLVVDQLTQLQATSQHATLLGRTLHALAAPLALSPTALLALSALPYSPAMVQALVYRGSVLAHLAALRLHIARTAWPDDPLRLGCHARITVLKDKGGGRASELVISLDFEGLEVAG